MRHLRTKPFHLVNTNCPRCGKPTVTGSRSLYGADTLKKKLSGVCSACITQEEREEIDKTLAEYVYSTIRASR
jgi:hypothetical protein